MTPALIMDGVTHGYGGAPVLRDLSLKIDAGVQGILGNNGVGKSTLLKLAAGFMAPQHGQVSILGRNSRTDPHRARRDTAFLPENLALDDCLTGREFLEFSFAIRGLTVHRDALDAVLDALAVLPRADTLFGALSFGSRRKLGLASVLLSNARLLVLDEPGNGLDVASIQALEQLIAERAAAGVTVLISSHDMGFVTRTCQTARVLKADGNMVSGSIDTLIAQTGQADLHHAFATLNRP